MPLTMTLRHTVAATLASLSMFGAAPVAAQSGLDVVTAQGPLSGVAGSDLQSWLGVPFAAPPVGPLRWQPPQPLKPWTAVRKANTVASSCAQNADLGVFARAGGSEDCLYLNVYRSASAAQAGQKLPVFVWIHGGSLQVGQGADYDATKMALRGKAVVVTLNYRLGVFGFFAQKALDNEGHPSANYGLLDQQAALRWIKQNIAAFGGDPTNVTIAGESSGGNSVMLQIASPLAAGTFQHAIAMSGAGEIKRYPAFGAPRPLALAEVLGDQLAKEVGCTADTAACLRALPTKRVLDTQTNYLLNEAIIDGTVLPIHPADAYRTGRINHVTLVNGNTHDEGRFFVALPELASGKAMTVADYPIWLTRQFGAALAPKVALEYPLDRYDSPSEAFAAAATDSLFACTGRTLNRWLADKIPVYAYEFSDGTAPTYVAPTTFPLLASHTYELAYIFPGFRGGADVTVKLNPLQEKLSDQMVDYFAHVSDLPSRTEWNRFDAKRDEVMSFKLTGAKMESGKFAAFHRCDFWDRSGTY
ncbi:carboxylesterase family protein [Sphingomonas sp. PP-CC-3G-468]|uniref:carboxylesterase/lipase family protein n=1 Tax=Sphingomonas sp. PP-CC-3G-468 TaxID=2135656 RepID=UPI0010DA2FFF|nr:carboxylesterase family protein [Sphingomonas sp. PP-CC-3G-468]TCM07400.1 carboxylesterase type B [Sphingomonas sp. PP-CC-3G-468]